MATPDHYGCHNRAPYPALIPLPAVQPISVEGYVVNSEAVQYVKNVFSKDCQFTKTALGRADQKCMGCSWRDE
jgi:hypothetical protein